MKLRLWLVLLTGLAIVPQIIAADDDDDLGDLGIFADSKSTLKFGFRFVTGPKVHFGNLGTVPFPNSIALPSAGESDRNYADGKVIKDSARILGVSSEVDANGQQTSTPGGRYTVVDANGVIQGNFLSYTPGVTRYWSYTNASQVVPVGTGSGIALNLYGATSQGASFEAKKKYSDGFELQVERNLGKLGKRWDVNLLAGLAVSTITGDRTGNVQSTLNVIRDVFSLNGQPAPTAPYTGPTYGPLTLPDTTVLPSGYENTTTLASIPSSHTESSTLDGANVSGVWKISGAYFIMRLGPELRAMLTKDISLSTSAGFSAAYAGSTYSAVESFTVTGIADPVETQESSVTSKYFSGFYANMDAQWQLNDRTGVYAGVSYESVGSYDQSVGGRTAKIDLSGTVGVRGGISIKF
jgi:hypothetical protein